jgi:amidophosphoribosyltransferase
MLDEERQHFIEEACGIFGIHGNAEAANHAYLGLHALQHRGQESAGIATTDEEGEMWVQRRVGLVNDGFNRRILETLPGPTAIGHVRYSTSGESTLENAQPITVSTKFGPLALAHNGNLTNADQLRKKLESQGSIFGTTTDTEVIAHLIAKSLADSMRDAIFDALNQVEGAYSLLCLTRDFMLGIRDPNGVRPLCCGELDDGSRVMASEPSSFNLIGAEFDRDIDAGEGLIVHGDGSEEWVSPFSSQRSTPCIFELVYFSRPDSTVFGRDVYEARKEMGRELARESHVDADLVIPVPDSGVPAAMGYAEEADIPFEMGLVRSHYVGRTFIEPSSSIRHFGVKLKLSPVESVLEDQRVVVVDDSIVRGTTSQKIVRMLRETGVEEVHFRVASPQTTNPCYYGIDTPEREELIAASHTEDEICEHVTADTLSYLSIDGLRNAVDAEVDAAGNSSFCEACFTGDYPIPTHQESTPESSGSDGSGDQHTDGQAARTQPVESVSDRVSGKEGRVGPPPEAQGGRGKVRPQVDAAVHFEEEE